MSNGRTVSIQSADSFPLTPMTPQAMELGPTGKRLDYITWHQHHMFMARTLAEMSPWDMEKASGCYIVDNEHYQISSGYSQELEKCEEVCRHDISVALLRMERKGKSGEDCVMYTTRFPECADCVNKILKLKISKIWYWTSSEGDDVLETKKKLEESGVTCEQYQPTRTISVSFHENS